MVDIKTRCCGTVICSGATKVMAIWQAVRDGVSLSWADLGGLDFHHLWIPGADLSYAKLQDTNFRGANLKGSNLTGALVAGANFSGANLSRVNYTNCRLYGNANLSGADVTDLFYYGQPPSASSPSPVAQDASGYDDGVFDSRCEYDPETNESFFTLDHQGTVIYFGTDIDERDRIWELARNG